ncbi:alpha/beta hydrolase [Nonomuraea rosea]|uniref:Alpha/beta hydrolase n=1 Tax=Nonomuraea rosea TaxID=638574 RepID=A0ABP6XF84_9ACTN
MTIVQAGHARLYTERTGDGPALVLVPGGGGDTSAFDRVVPVLAERYTVLTLDRRGNSRSPIEGPQRPVDVGEQADDVVAVLDHYGLSRAYVFGTSASGIIALELLIRHPDRLLGAVVHEPPIVRVLPDAAERLAFFDEVRAVGEREGALRAYLLFASAIMARPLGLFRSRAGRAVVAAGLRASMAVRKGEPGGMQRLFGNAEVVVRSEIPAFLAYEPNLSALGRVPAPWCFAVGAASEGRFYARPARLLGERLGAEVAELPGGHLGYQEFPREFGDRLAATLDGFRARR